ncbi:MAG: aminotransferase class V-fold PLP-dependent enzyme, partial [Rhodobacteraceae bacterium]|nr:aminotransferase class V-fold PLP-dependent enzyme [Paracoccaceae bacterium]
IRETYFELLSARLDLVAARYGGHAEDWVFVENATAACNAVFLSERLAAGDEVLFTSAIYGAVRKALSHWHAGRGVRFREVDLALPVESPQSVTAAIGAALSPRVKLLVIDHITSTSALLLPVAEIAAICRTNGTRVLVDGAHAPGQIALDLPSLGVDYYTGNAHKWQFAPKGCALLWVRPGLGDGVHPTVISHGLGAGLRAEFGWTGTRDSSPWFAFAEAAAAHDAFGGAGLMARNRTLAAEAGAFLAKALGTELSGPAEMRAAMATVLLPGNIPTAARDRVAADFSRRYQMETSFVPWQDRLAVRISAQVYNEMSDYERLLTAIRDYFALP